MIQTQTVVINKTQRKIFSTSDYYPTITKATKRFREEYGHGEPIDDYRIIIEELPSKISSDEDAVIVYFIEEINR